VGVVVGAGGEYGDAVGADCTGVVAVAAAAAALASLGAVDGAGGAGVVAFVAGSATGMPIESDTVAAFANGSVEVFDEIFPVEDVGAT